MKTIMQQPNKINAKNLGLNSLNSNISNHNYISNNNNSHKKTISLNLKDERIKDLTLPIKGHRTAKNSSRFTYSNKTLREKLFENQNNSKNYVDAKFKERRKDKCNSQRSNKDDRAFKSKIMLWIHNSILFNDGHKLGKVGRNKSEMKKNKENNRKNISHINLKNNYVQDSLLRDDHNLNAVNKGYNTINYQNSNKNGSKILNNNNNINISKNYNKSTIQATSIRHKNFSIGNNYFSNNRKPGRKYSGKVRYNQSNNNNILLHLHQHNSIGSLNSMNASASSRAKLNHYKQFLKKRNDSLGTINTNNHNKNDINLLHKKPITVTSKIQNLRNYKYTPKIEHIKSLY